MNTIEKSAISMLGITVAVLVCGGAICAALPAAEDERYVDKEYASPSPGGHELASWLIAQLRQASNQVPTGGSGCRYPSAAKRNSEIINALLRLPKEMDNGRK